MHLEKKLDLLQLLLKVDATKTFERYVSLLYLEYNLDKKIDDNLQSPGSNFVLGLIVSETKNYNTVKTISNF